MCSSLSLSYYPNQGPSRWCNSVVMSRCHIGIVIKKNTLFAAGDQIYVFKTQEKFCGIINLSFRLPTSVCYSNRKTYSVTWCDKVVKGKKPKSCYPACPHFVFYLTLYKFQMPCQVSVSQVLYDIPDLLTKKKGCEQFPSYALGKNSGSSTCQYY